jgi:hypothetical protein
MGLPAPANRSGSSDPLVGDLPRRARIRGSTDRVLTCDDGSRTSPRTVVDVAWDPRVISGFDPSSSVLVWCCLAQDPFLR